MPVRAQCSLSLVIVTCLLIAMHDASARAQSSRYQFNIFGQSLSQALRTFAEVSGEDIVFTEELVAGLAAAELRGTFTPEAALERLLQGSGLIARRSASGALMIMRKEHNARSSDSFQRDPKPTADHSIHGARTLLSETLVGRDADLEEITVTGSRISRSGFEAPTPVTVFSAERLRNEVPIHIADSLNQLPVMGGGLSLSNNGVNTSNGEAGSATLNLRGMGAGRTLVLFDGRRVVSVGLRGTTDVSHIPTTLLKRIDIVTGGASAPFGSDAMTGIVNFVLDRDFVGFSGNMLAGITTYGDNEQFKAELAFGRPFADGRGHFILGAEKTEIAGISSTGGQRPWTTNTKAVVNAAYTPTNGQPYFLARPNAEFSNMAPGLLITTGPLAGTEFFADGLVRPFQYGANVTSGLLMEGGADTDTQRTQLLQSQRRANVFARASFAIADDVDLWSDFFYSKTAGINDCCNHFFPGNVTIQIDNAFLPASIVERMTELGITSFQAGTTNEDQQTLHGHNVRDMRQFAVGARGAVPSSAGWRWEAYAQRGVSRTNLRVHQMNRTRWNLAIDAVRDPLTGNIVCRSTLTDPGNGCVPLNRFGVGTVSKEAEGYVIGFSPYEEEVTQDVTELSFTGAPFSTRADPVSVAVGAQYRREKVESYAEFESISNQWFAANFKPTFGAYDVLDGFMEAAVPLAKDASWAKSLELNTALRITNYSTSGWVNTWKVGATYEPYRGMRFRATQSRDIHSPGLGDLYRAGQVNSAIANDPFHNNVARTFNRPLLGNPDLMPEKADTTGLGVLWQPAAVPGLNLSADYFRIKVKDAFAVPDVQAVINRCFEGDQSYCADIERDSNGQLTFVTVRPLNADWQFTDGVDFEAAYHTPASRLVASWPGDLSIQALATYTVENRLIVNDVPIDVGGKNSDRDAYPGIPTWKWQASVTYSNDPIVIAATLRGVSAGVTNPAWIECKSACPESNVINRTVDDNSIGAALWLDASIRYRLGAGPEVYVRVDNALNRAPPPVADDYFLSQGFNASIYDTIGRTFRAGIRYAF